MRNPLLDDHVIDFGAESDVNNDARGPEQPWSSQCFTHAMVKDSCREFPRSVLQADTIIVSCGLANFEQSSWSTHCRHEFWGTHEELRTKEDYDKFVHSFKDNYTGIWKDRSIWTIDCRKFDDPDNDRSMRKHIGRNPKIMKSILETGNYHALHDRLYEGMSRFVSDKNTVIMICSSGRHRSVANAELWSNTLTICGRRQHSVSLLHLSELDFWENTCAGNCSECSKQSLRVLQAHYEQVQAECVRRVPVPDPVTGRWKRPRPEHAEGPAQPVKDPSDEEDNLPQTSKEQATSAAATLATTSTSCGTMDELAERLGRFHESARALASCLQKRDVPLETDQSIMEAAKCTFHKLLGR